MGRLTVEQAIKILLEVLSPAALILLLVVLWQFKSLKEKDDRLYELFTLITENTKTLEQLLTLFKMRRE